MKIKITVENLHTWALVNFTIGQPLFDLLSRNTEFFIAHRSESLDIYIFALSVIFLLPLPFILIETFAKALSPFLYKVTHFSFFVLLFTLLIMMSFKNGTSLTGTSILFIAIPIGILLGFIFLRYTPFQTFLTLLAISPIIFLLNFLFSKPVYTYLNPPDKQKAFSPEIKSDAPVFMIIFDEFPVVSLMNEKGLVDPVRYPNFSHFSKEAVWFRNTTAVADATVRGAIPAILTGMYPDKIDYSYHGSVVNSLFTLLSKSYDLKIFETITRVCPPDLCVNLKSLKERLLLFFSDLSLVYAHLVLPSDLTIGLPKISQKWNNYWEALDLEGHLGKIGLTKRKKIFEEYLDSIEANSRPSLNFLHILLPHIPWTYLPSGEQYGEVTDGYYGIPGLDFSEKWKADDWAVIQGYQRHLLQVGFVDTLVGSFIKKLKKENLYDQAIVILTADHGTSFRAGNYRRQYTEESKYEILPIPLMIKLPGQKKGILSDKNAESVDILPTIMDLLNISPPWKTDGHSLLDDNQPVRKEKRVFLLSGSNQRENRKVIYTSYDPFGKYRELKKKIDLFATGGEGDTLFRNGPYNGLIGKSVESLTIVEEGITQFSIKIDSRKRERRKFDSLPPASPLPVSGVLNFKGNREVERPSIAIAVNGVISAVTLSFVLSKKVALFYSFIPQHFLDLRGKNTIRFFRLYGDRENPLLEPVHPE